MPEPIPYLYLVASVVIYAYNMTYAHSWPFLAFLKHLLSSCFYSDKDYNFFFVACLAIDLLKQRGGLKWFAAQSRVVSLMCLM